MSDFSRVNSETKYSVQSTRGGGGRGGRWTWIFFQRLNVSNERCIITNGTFFLFIESGNKCHPIKWTTRHNSILDGRWKSSGRSNASDGLLLRMRPIGWWPGKWSSWRGWGGGGRWMCSNPKPGLLTQRPRARKRVTISELVLVLVQPKR